MRPERLGQLGREVHPPALSALGCRDNAVVDSPPALSKAPVEVEVAPLEGDDLADAHASAYQAQNERIVAREVPLAHIEKERHLVP